MQAPLRSTAPVVRQHRRRDGERPKKEEPNKEGGRANIAQLSTPLPQRLARCVGSRVHSTSPLSRWRHSNTKAMSNASSPADCTRVGVDAGVRDGILAILGSLSAQGGGALPHEGMPVALCRGVVCLDVALHLGQLHSRLGAQLLDMLLHFSHLEVLDSDCLPAAIH